ncbi:conserved hypothetical protein [Pediculus humanus corporis]|uniref:Proline-rich transmembrane protein 3/4 domain-containing protein n=1 Tax=Pediculus humanus subsp. corporis TaxID=121224 RepID=E0VFF9_PEDHC|nr:uncharacterized protein Phum_PHUM156840 [Pediculus humanus corporis]EEB12115.1 conserved hypothetical protein [Pediculus humanus corporis]
MSTINGFLCLLGTSRAGSLLIDPYNLKEIMPKIIGQIMWDLGFPSIISAFCLVQLAFLQLTQIQIGPEGLRRKSCLSLIVTAHFILTIGMDIIIVRYVIQYIFLTWGVFLCCNFLYSGYKVMSMIRNIPGGLKHRDLPDPSYKAAGSSGDEKSTKLLTRGSSFQNQTRNTQKFNLKPKLSLRSISDEDVTDKDLTQYRNVEPKSPKCISPKSLSPKQSTKTKEFNFANDLKEMEIVREKKIYDVDEETVEINRKDKMKKSNMAAAVAAAASSSDNNNKGNDGGMRRGSQIMNEGSRKNSFRKDSVSFTQGDSSGSCSTLMDITTKTDEDLIISSTSKNQRQKGKRKIKKKLSWKKNNKEKNAGDDDDEEDDDEDDDDEEETTTQECLLGGKQENATDVSLRSVLNHIAYINRGQQRNGHESGDEDLEKGRKSKVEWVLNITYITAMWGLMLCLSNMGRIYSPFGVPDSRRVVSSLPKVSTTFSSNSTHRIDHVPTGVSGGSGGGGGSEIIFSPWPWLWFQTFCRALELAMGCAMANITRQPTANYRYPRTLSLRHRDTFYSI